jgi:hypothetical protein
MSGQLITSFRVDDPQLTFCLAEAPTSQEITT